MKNQIRKMLSLSLAAVMALSLTACGVGGTAEAPAASEAAVEETVETSTDIMSSEEYEYGGYRIVDNNGTWSIEDEEGTVIAEGFSSDDEARDYIDEE